MSHNVVSKSVPQDIGNTPDNKKPLNKTKLWIIIVVAAVVAAVVISLPVSQVITRNAGAVVDAPEIEQSAPTALDVDISDELVGSLLIEVPDVVGKTKASAEYAITAVGFRVGNVSYENSDLPVDTVIR